jgi:hypothetical protein
MDTLRIFSSSMHVLPTATIFPLHGMYDDVSPPPPTSMHFQKIGISPFQELGMWIHILQECIEVGGEGHTTWYISYSGKMVVANNSYMDEVNILKESILRGLRWWVLVEWFVQACFETIMNNCLSLNLLLSKLMALLSNPVWFLVYLPIPWWHVMRLKNSGFGLCGWSSYWFISCSPIK